MRKKNRPSKQDGFTLTELLVVLLILSLIAAAITPQVMGRLDKSKVRAAKIQLETLSASLDMFKIDTGRYPTTQEGLETLIISPTSLSEWSGPYVRSSGSIVDPWGRQFLYNAQNGNSSFTVSTLGADGQEGGDKFNADLKFPDYSLAK